MHVTISVNGEAAKELTITPQTGGVYHLISLRPFVGTGRNVVALEVAGKGGLADQIVATHYAPWAADEAPAEKEMTIDVQYDATTLKADDLLTGRATIRYNRPGDATMTIVDLGVPPGFEVLAEDFDALEERGVIQRYALTGRQVILYFDRIPGGRDGVFAWRMRAKFPVKAKTPPATVHQYYEPEARDTARPVELTVL